MYITCIELQSHALNYISYIVSTMIHHISGQSLGNVDESAYVSTADWRIPLTDLGKKQAHGKKVACSL